MFKRAVLLDERATIIFYDQALDLDGMLAMKVLRWLALQADCTHMKRRNLDKTGDEPASGDPSPVDLINDILSVLEWIHAALACSRRRMRMRGSNLVDQSGDCRR